MRINAIRLISDTFEELKSSQERSACQRHLHKV